MWKPDVSDSSSLDDIRLKEGNDKFREVFSDIAISNAEEAICLLNDERIQFPTLFTLLPEIRKHDFCQHLSSKSKCAMFIVDSIFLKNLQEAGWSEVIKNNDENYTVLKWILRTGYMEDGLNEQYDEILDAVSAILAVSYKNKESLRYIGELIFNRNRRGFYIYDLVWAFFEASDPGSLSIIASFLRSKSRKDVLLAKRLLSFIPCLSKRNEGNNLFLYRNAIDWISRNRNYLYYTGESNLQTPAPERYAVSLNAKYLQKHISVITGDLTRSLSEDERRQLKDFGELDSGNMIMLSEYSVRLYRFNKYWWNKWIHLPVADQIEIARRMLRRIYD